MHKSREIGVSICSWNVGGLISDHHNKTIDPLFIKQIQNCDMVLLTETHVGYNTPVNIDCFLYYPFCRETSRFFGGLGVLIRKNIRKGIAIIQDGNSEYQWIKLKKRIF